MNTEIHPFEPFLPKNTRILMAGTFPPKPNRWAMPFYYPNRTNDMWQIWGLIGFGDKNYFLDEHINAEGRKEKGFKLDLIKAYCREIGLGMTDTGYEVHRQMDNAADKFLTIVRPFDLDAILAKVPMCHSLVVTGELAGETLRSIMGFDEPLKIGHPQNVEYNGRNFMVWRCPSSSRAYPMKVEKKAEYYRAVLDYENSRTGV